MTLRSLQIFLLAGLFAWITPPAAANEFCALSCHPFSSCEQPCLDEVDCVDEEIDICFSTCGEFGTCDNTPPPCQDPKRVTTRVDTSLVSSTVTASLCHFDHWFPFDPFAWPRVYNYTSFTIRRDTVRITEFCDGHIEETITASTFSTASCAQRTWVACFNPFGPPPLTCA